MIPLLTSSSPDAYSIVFWLTVAILAGVYGLSKTPPVTPGADYAPPAHRRRQAVPVAPDPHAHPFIDLPVTALISHCFDHHFEVWNHLGEKSPALSTWRKEHAVDHGVVLRTPRAKRVKV